MIVDATMALRWVLADPGSEGAQALIGREDLICPDLLFMEVAGALWEAARRGRIDAPDVVETLKIMPGLFVQVEAIMAHTPRAIEIAFRMNYPVYACVYLALAEALNDKLVTADLPFIEHARAAGFGDRVLGPDLQPLLA